MFITVTASNGESAKEVMLRKCQTSSTSSASNFSCSKLEPFSLTHQLKFEAFSPDFFPCGALFELPCDKLAGSSLVWRRRNQLLAVYLSISKWTRTFAFLRRHKHRRLVIVQTRQFAYGHAATARDNPLTAIN